MNENLIKILLPHCNIADGAKIEHLAIRVLHMRVRIYEVEHFENFSVITLLLYAPFQFTSWGALIELFEILQTDLLGVGIGENFPSLSLLYDHQQGIWLDKTVPGLLEVLESTWGEPQEVQEWYFWPLSKLEVKESPIDPNSFRLTESLRDRELAGRDVAIESNTSAVHIGSNYSETSSETSQIPFVSKAEPLPHDGLFVRRNNAFGTRLTAGIKEMLGQGVMIDQRNIRFDDFITSDIDQVPMPSSGQAIAVSHGVAEVPPNCKYHQDTTHYLEIALRAANNALDTHLQRQPVAVDYVFVLDTSGSMSGEKMDTVKASIRELFQQMKDDDIIGIVAFDTSAKTVLKATPKRQIDFSEFAEKLRRLDADGGTDINLGLQFGISEVQRYAQPDIVKQLYLFSDGNPNSGECNWVKIRQKVADQTRGDIHLSVFGFGSDVNQRELDALAGVTGGQYTFVVRPDEVKLALRDDLKRREHLAAMNIQAKIEIDPDISILHFYGHDLITDPASRDAVLRDAEEVKQMAEEQLGVKSQPDIITEEKGIRIFAPDLAIGETYWIVLELAVSPERTDLSFGKATVQYTDTFLRENKRHEFNLSVVGTLPSEVVILHGLGLWTSEVTFYALDDLYEQDYTTARKRIEEHIKVLEPATEFLPSEPIRDDIISLRKLIALAGNMGQGMAYSEDAGSYAVYALNAFGRVRCGLTRRNF